MEQAILSQLDEAAENFMLPGLPNEYFLQAAQRLTVFTGADEWLLVYEIVGYDVRNAAFVDSVYAFGNRLERNGLQEKVPVVMRADGSDPWDGDDFTLSVDALEVAANGRVHNLEPTEQDLKDARVAGGRMPEPARVIRLLAHLLGDELFLPTERLLEICGREGLEVLLQVSDWQQPDLAKFERPSEMPCVQSLAKAVAAGEADQYECPERYRNARWWHWED